ncbi:hypothetical protein Tsubulata_017897 [Turnera subulata]|uniref:Uncharacterized protein n=1 Tax=Turnera subulata TaxID=218843 RepID=A0A9Q0F259_9ROSI|nr:hypothetical protein Tsubulata_017897 [Turnera subulata]
MMQSEIFQPSWPQHSFIMNSSAGQVELYGLDLDACEFSSSFSNQEDISDTSSIPHLSTVFPCDFSQSPASDCEMQVSFPAGDFLVGMEGFEPHFDSEMEYLLSESEGSFPLQEMSSEGENAWSPSPSIKSMETSMNSGSILSLPCEDAQPDSKLGLLHLLKAYGEAMEKGQRELADVIMRCVSEKVNPAGEILERLGFYLSQDMEKQACYLRQESCKNFEAAFRAFYQILPHGRFAHFAANSAILEAMPTDAEIIHIVDFDMGEGIQWPPMIEALAQRHRALRLTAIRWGNDDSDAVPSMLRFEQAKKRLVDHAKCFGLKIKVEEMGILELVDEIKKTNKRDGKKELLAFNCMIGLPHMGRVRSRKFVEEFLKVANELVANSVHSKASGGGIVTFGDGYFWEDMTVCSGLGSFFEGNVVHYQALLDSIESNFPMHLAEARMAVECLFVAPYVSSHAWLQRWRDIGECNNVPVEARLQEWRASKKSFEEAREMVKGNQSFYEVKSGGNRGNQMILEWKGTPLVRALAWRH